jgi:hypothetical protein
MSRENVEIVTRYFGATPEASATTGVSIFSVLTLREGFIAEADEYLSRADALEAVGPAA